MRKKYNDPLIFPSNIRQICLDGIMFILGNAARKIESEFRRLLTVVILLTYVLDLVCLFPPPPPQGGAG